MANNVIDAAIRLRDLFTPTVRSVNASLGTMKTQMGAAKQSVSGLSDKLTEHERIQKRTAKSIEQTGSKISGLSDKMALLSAPPPGSRNGRLQAAQRLCQRYRQDFDFGRHDGRFHAEGQ